MKDVYEYSYKRHDKRREREDRIGVHRQYKRCLGVAVDGDVDSSADCGQVLQLIVADDVEGVSTDVLQQLGGAGVAVTSVSAHLELAVLGQQAGGTSLAQSPQAALVIHQEGAAAQAGSTTDVFQSADDLILATQTITHTDALGALHGCRSIGGSTGADCQNQLNLMLLGQLDHGGDVVIAQEPDTLGLGNTVDVEAQTIELVQQSLHDGGTLDAGNLETILAAVIEALLGSGQVVQIAAGQTDALQPGSGLLHSVHVALPLSKKLYFITRNSM